MIEHQYWTPEWVDQLLQDGWMLATEDYELRRQATCRDGMD